MSGEISLGEYRALVRLAALLLYDASAAEDVVREAFVAVHAGPGRPRDRGKALCCLRREVVSRSRLAVRSRAVADRTVPAFLAALRSLPGRQREAIVLRYYAGLPEGETAASMGVSRGAVRNYTALGIAALKPALEQDAP